MSEVNIEQLQEMITDLEQREKTPQFTPFDAARLKALRIIVQGLKNGTIVVGSLSE